MTAASSPELSASRPEAEAAAALFDRHGRRIFALCLSRLGNRDDADDATQTTFLHALRALDRGVVPACEVAWLATIAENVCRNRHRWRGYRRLYETPRDLDALQAVLAAPGRDRDELIGLVDALAAMPAAQRRALLLREWRGLSYDELARELGLSRSAVEALVFRARRSLARLLGGATVRARRILDVGSVASALRTLVPGGTAKLAVAAGVSALAVASVPASDGASASRNPRRPAAPAAHAPWSVEAASAPAAALARRGLVRGAGDKLSQARARPAGGGGAPAAAGAAAPGTPPSLEPRPAAPSQAGSEAASTKAAAPTETAATAASEPAPAPVDPVTAATEPVESAVESAVSTVTSAVPAPPKVEPPSVSVPSVPSVPAVPTVTVPELPLP